MSAPHRLATGIAGLALLIACGRLPTEATQSPFPSAPSSGSPLSVVVAVRDVAAGVPLTAEDVAQRELPAAAVDRDHTFTSTGDVIGRYARQRILAEEPVRVERLGGNEDAAVGLSSTVHPGRVALTIPVTAQEGHSDLLKPGEYVDIAFAPDPARTHDPSSDGARVIIQAAKLVAVDHSQDLPKAAGKEAPRYRDSQTITLELDDADVRRLLIARAAGSIQVSERSVIDVMQFQAAPVTLEVLRAGE